ncbi:MAG: ATP-dependent DNA helicase RecG [Clostridiales bacterium]|nr:ATP-dependent DNA helicase RecG [Clostridiales bacterium]
MELKDLLGVGKARLAALHAAGIDSLRDLLFAVPFQYRDLGRRTTVAQAREGERQTLLLERVGEPRLYRYGKRSRVTCALRDETGELLGCWFNQPWMREALLKRPQMLMFGKVNRVGRRLQLTNPSLEERLRVVPVYRPMDGVPQKTREQLVQQALAAVESLCPETLPETVLARYGLMPLPEAMLALHAPTDLAEAGEGQRRFAFEQMLLYQVAVREMRGARREGRAFSVPRGAEDSFWRAMPFSPTGAQRRTLREVADDLRAPAAMARMVQGDVGCGKTAVAFGAIRMCAEAGYQSALMAPTEILARQHFHSAKQLLEPMGLRCGLLLGGLGVRERREALAAIASGAWQVVVGTHALIGEGVSYARLGLCVTDEQHRFGVEQRTRLLRKAGDTPPDLLVMSATPIPRTLALAMFGDLDVSVIDELPPGRTPVQTRIVPQNRRKDMYLFLRREIENGHQAYVVCPLVEEDEADEQRKAVESHFEALCRGPLKGIPVGLTHGRQPSAEKAAVLDAFAEGKLRALVATTVIEVGVNVPNATVMVVENAERYGLAQLHQLRGRVGRGGGESWCFLVAQENERLRTLVRTNDGFEVARKDLELRGPGEMLGTRQHGVSLLPEGVALSNIQLLHDAVDCAEALSIDAANAAVYEDLRTRAAALVRKTMRDVSVS